MLARYDGGALHVLGQVDVRHPVGGDGFQGVLRPVEEPVDRAAVYQRREQPQTIAERRTDRTEAEDDVEAFAGAFREEVVDRQLADVELLVAALRGQTDHLEDLLFLVDLVDVRHLRIFNFETDI